MRLSSLSPLLFLLVALVGCTHDRDDQGMAEAGAPDAGGAVPFMERCDPNDDRCEEGLTCFSFPAKGFFCTHPCAGDEECADPSPGCNNMGVCKVP